MKCQHDKRSFVNGGQEDYTLHHSLHHLNSYRWGFCLFFEELNLGKLGKNYLILGNLLFLGRWKNMRMQKNILGRKKSWFMIIAL